MTDHGWPPLTTPRPAPDPPATVQSVEDMLWAVLVVHGLAGVAVGAWVAWRLARRRCRRV